MNVLTTKEGLPTYFKMGRDIIGGIGFLIPYTLSIALLPFFCDLSHRDDRQQLGKRADDGDPYVSLVLRAAGHCGRRGRPATGLCPLPR